MGQLGLPGVIRAVLFDLDGVLTHTAALHFQAWKEMFDGYLEARARAAGQPWEPFDSADYLLYIDGKPRAEGVLSFLASRAITLDYGSSDDPPGAETVQGLGNRKNELVHSLMESEGVHAFEGSRRYLRAVSDAGLGRAVVSASTNTPAVLRASGLAGYVSTVVDGNVALARHLRGKPHPDTFLYAARQLDVAPEHAAVFEDALAGVRAGRAGGFGFVVGVDRAGQREALLAEGADIVVEDLGELLEDG